MNATELKNGKKEAFGKFYTGYCLKDKMYYAGRHMSSQRIIQFDTFSELQEWVSWNK